MCLARNLTLSPNLANKLLVFSRNPLRSFMLLCRRNTDHLGLPLWKTLQPTETNILKRFRFSAIGIEPQPPKPKPDALPYYTYGAN